MQLVKNKIQEHYHWVILIILLIHSVIYGGVGNVTSVYLIPVTEGLNISRGLFSTLSSIASVTITVATLMITHFFHKFGYRLVAGIAMGLFALSCLVSGLSNNAYVYAIGRILYGLGCSALGITGVVWIMRAWFHKHYGTFLGIVTMGTGIGGMISAVASAGMIESFGWQWAYIITAAVVALTIPLFFLVRNTPKEMGLRPFGEGQFIPKGHKDTRRMQQWKGVGVKKTRCHPAFKLMCVFMFLLNFCLYCPWTVVVPHFQDNGYTALEAASYHSVMMLALAVFKFLCGYISEKIGGKALGVVCLVCTIVGHFGFIDVSNPYICYLWMVLLAISMTLTTVTIPLLIESVFGVETGSQLVGTFVGLASAAAVVSAPVCNFIYDIIGSYGPIFMVVGVLDVIWLVVLFVIFRMYGKVEKQWLAEHSA